MSRPIQSGPGDEFFTDLRSHLLANPAETMTRRHVTGAARLALSARVVRRGRLRRSSLVAISLSTVLGTTGVAVAGSLPAPVQGAVADVARLLPIPLPVPYPVTPTTARPAPAVTPDPAAGPSTSQDVPDEVPPIQADRDGADSEGSRDVDDRELQRGEQREDRERFREERDFRKENTRSERDDR